MRTYIYEKAFVFFFALRKMISIPYPHPLANTRYGFGNNLQVNIYVKIF